MLAKHNNIVQAKPIFLPEMEVAVLDALRNDRFLHGENVIKFEEEFRRMIGTDYAVSTSSGTNALAFILTYLGAAGKKYVTTPLSFIASANAILHANGIPVFGDISTQDYCLDPVETERQLKEGASGILPVHIYGQPVDFDAFQELADRYHVPIVEDACQAHGARYKGRMVGNLGTAAAFSFYPSKNMNVLGDGGMVTTNDEKMARTIAKMTDSGRTSRYEHDILGYTARLNTVNAAIGRVQLRHLEEWNSNRRRTASAYRSGLQHLDELVLPPAGGDGVEPVYHQFVIVTKDRDGLKKHLEEQGIETGVHYPIPIHLQPLYRRMYGYAEGAYPKSERFSKTCLSLPMHPFLTVEETSYVCESIAGFYRTGR